MYIMEDDLNLNKWQFAQRKFLPYETKITLTERRIKEWYENWNGNVYVSFSGGLDSTVLLHFIRKVLGDSVPAVFVNTGLEYPEIVDFAKSFESRGKFKEMKPRRNFKEVILEEGYPLVSKDTASKIRKLRRSKLSQRYRNYLLNGDERGKFGMLAKKWRFLISAPFDISEKCCDIMKKEPFKRYQRETALGLFKKIHGRKPKRGESLEGYKPYPYIGTTQDESFRREHQYAKTGCNVYDGSTIKSQPLGFWRKQDILRYAYENNIGICSIYGEIKKLKNGEFILTGEQRTGCMFCLMGCHLESEPNRFQRMQTTHPNQYHYCMKPVEEGGLGEAFVLDYVGIPYTTWRAVGQMNITDYDDCGLQEEHAVEAI